MKLIFRLSLQPSGSLALRNCNLSEAATTPLGMMWLSQSQCLGFGFLKASEVLFVRQSGLLHADRVPNPSSSRCSYWQADVGVACKVWFRSLSAPSHSSSCIVTRRFNRDVILHPDLPLDRHLILIPQLYIASISNLFFIPVGCSR